MNKCCTLMTRDKVLLFLTDFFLFDFYTTYKLNIDMKKKTNEQKAILLHGTICFRFAEIHR